MSAPSVDVFAQNAASLERLRNLVGRLYDDALLRQVDTSWTVGALLAHLAFWERLALRRWKRFLEEARFVDTNDARDLINDAALGQWRALPTAFVRAEVIAAAEETNRFIAALPAERVAEALRRGTPFWVDRSTHRLEHIAQIESALGHR